MSESLTRFRVPRKWTKEWYHSLIVSFRYANHFLSLFKSGFKIWDTVFALSIT